MTPALFKIGNTYTGTENTSLKITILSRTPCFLIYSKTINGESSPFGSTEKRRIKRLNCGTEYIIDGVLGGVRAYQLPNRTKG